MGAARGDPAAGVGELLAHAGQLQPVGLLRVQPPVARVEPGQRLEVLGQGRLQLRRRRGDPGRDREVAAQLVDQRRRPARAVLVLERQHRAGVGRADGRVAVAVAADPAAERERRRVERRLDPELAQLHGQFFEHVGDRPGRQLVEVIDRVARLVEHLGPGDADLVGLPEQVDQLFQPGHRPRGRRLVAVGGLEVVEQPRQLAQLGEDGAARRLGRVGGEDRAHVEAADQLAQLGGVAGAGVLGADPRHRLGQPAAAGLAPARRPVASAVDLLGDVGEVEVGGEGAGEAARGGRIGARQGRRRGGAIVADRQPHHLHPLEHRLALLAHQRAPQRVAEVTDVTAEEASVGHQLTRRVALGRCKKSVSSVSNRFQISMMRSSTPASPSASSSGWRR